MDFDVKPKRIVESDIISDSIQKIDKLQNFLELNGREFSILVEVYHLNQEGARPDAQQVGREYVEWYMKDVSMEQVEKAVSNLKGKGFLKGDELQADVNKVIEFIVDKNTRLKGEKLQDSIINNIEYYLDRAHQTLIRPLLLYLPVNELAEVVVKELKQSKLSRLYVTSNFPSEICTKRLFAAYSEPEAEYFLSVSESISKGELEAFYMTRFDVEELYEDALKVFDYKEDALKECLIVVDSIRELVKLPNLAIYYLRFPFGLDGILPIAKKPVDFFLKARDPHNRLIGGIYIKSPVIASQVKRVYDETIRNATRITERNCEKLISTLKKNLTEVHARK